MRARIADYDVIRPIGDGPAAGSAGSGPADTDIVLGSESDPTSFVAQPPDRLGLGGAPVVLHTLGPAADPVRQVRQEWIYALAGARSPYLPALLELGMDDGEAPVEASGTYWSHTFTGDATLSAPPFTLSLAYVLWLIAGAARAAHALHEAGVAHGNITGRAVRFNQQAVTLDLPPFPTEATDGLVRFVRPVVDLDLVDPAVARGELPSRASDIWSLGALLHLGLTAQLLHAGLADDPPVTAVQRIMFEPPTITPLPEPIGRIVTSCLSFDPARRPATAADLAEQLEILGRQQ
jgi:eukaryotic-like serine/threonine-protein kinase